MSRSRRSARRISLWALLVAGQALSGRAYADRLPVVALDLSGLSEVEHRELDGVALEHRAVLRLLQEGFTVSAPGAIAAPIAGRSIAIVRVTLEGEGLRLSCADGTWRDERTVRWARGAPLPELHWLVAQKVAELARSWRDGAEAAAATDTGAPPAAWRLGAGLGGRSRAGRADPAVTVAWAREGAELHLEGRAQATWSREGPLSVQDLELLLGASRRWPLARRWSLSAALLAGPSVHRYSSSLAGDPRPSGLRPGLAIESALGVALRASDALELGLRVAPGLAWPRISHTRAGEVLWRGGPHRLEVAFTVERRVRAQRGGAPLARDGGGTR